MKYTDELYAAENTMLPTDLEEHYSGPGAHPIFTRNLWRDAVLNQDTLQGYWGWVQHQITSWEPDQEDADKEAAYRERAIELYASDECEFDDNCAVSMGADAGAWVACWRWISEL